MDFSFLIPEFFEWWHIPFIFLAGLIGESYGAIIGSGSIVTQWALLLTGMPLPSVIATDIAAALGTDFGILSVVKDRIRKHKKLIIAMAVAIFTGGALGTAFLSSVSTEIIKYILIIVLILLLTYLIFHGNQKTRQDLEHQNLKLIHYVLLFGAMFLIGIYNNTISVGEGTFGKIMLMSLLGMSFIDSHGIKSIAIIPARIYSLIVTTTMGLLALPYLLTLWLSNFIAGKYATKFARKIPDHYMRRLLMIVTLGYMMYLFFL